MNVAYVSAIRFPSERAHALYIALVLEAFLPLVSHVEAVVPRRFARDEKTPKEYFGTTHDIPTRYLPTLDVTFVPHLDRFAYFCYTLTFLLSLFFYALPRRKTTIFFANDMVVALLLSCIVKKVVYEVHDYPGVHFRFLYRVTFRRVTHILVNTHAKQKDLTRDFCISETKCIVAPNGVEYDFFAIPLRKEEARAKLALPLDKKIALYTGSLFSWKGVDTLARAAEHTHTEIYFVGGGETHLKKFSEKYAHLKNVHVFGHVPHVRMPVWLRAADVLVVPNTATSELSASHTSPMKLFEYMASGTPIVATDVPSLREVMGEGEGLFVAPDDPQALAKAVDCAMLEHVLSASRALRAQERAQRASWKARAQAILDRVQKVTNGSIGG